MANANGDIVYTELDNATRLAMVKQRIRDMETTYQQLSLRVNTPSPGEIITTQDRDNIELLKTNLAELRKLADSLEPPAPRTGAASR